jgi:hypothetical protein
MPASALEDRGQVSFLMKLQMKREALVKLNRMANEQTSVENSSYDTARVN